MATLDPKKIIVVIGGIIPTGYADGTFVEITPVGEDFKYYHGATGTNARAAQHNNAAMLKLTLDQTSISNTQLAILRGADVITSAAEFPVLIKNLNGTTAHAAAACSFVTQPAEKFGREVDTLEWEIMMLDYEGAVGGML